MAPPVQNKLPFSIPSGSHQTLKNQPSGNVFKSQNTSSQIKNPPGIYSVSNLAASVQRKFPPNISSGGTNNVSSSIALPSVQKRLLFSIPSDVPVKKRRCPRGQSSYTTETTTGGEVALQSTTLYPHIDVNHQVHESNEVLEAIARAEEVLESTPTDHNREDDRQVHISNEVLEAHYEEMNESDSDCATASFTSDSTLRKTRGPTQATSVTPPKGEKWKCLFIDEQPVGQAASKLAIVLGLYARLGGYFPPYKQWKDQSPQSFNDVMKDIIRDYDFVDIEGMPVNMMVVTSFCQESLKKIIKDWRCWLKKHYYIEGVPDEVLVKASDKRITQVMWESLLRYWGSDNKVVEAERNKRNRSENRPTHTLGAKSIARHNQEEDKVVATCVERDVMNSSEPCVLSPILDMVYKGHHGGYERGRGLGWSRAMCWSKKEIHASNENVKHLTVELQNVRAEIEAMQAREKEIEARQLEQIEAMKAHERGMQESNREMKERLEKMEALLSIHFSNGSALVLSVEAQNKVQGSLTNSQVCALSQLQIPSHHPEDNIDKRRI